MSYIIKYMFLIDIDIGPRQQVNTHTNPNTWTLLINYSIFFPI